MDRAPKGHETVHRARRLLASGVRRAIKAGTRADGATLGWEQVGFEQVFTDWGKGNEEEDCS